MTKPYRPSNGTEAMMFDDVFCSRCIHDKAYRDGGMEDGELGCKILADTLCYDVEDPEYPKQWVWDGLEPDGNLLIIGAEHGARCTEFEEITYELEPAGRPGRMER